MHDLRLIHTDLKPENILLVSSESIRVPDYKVVTELLTFCLPIKVLFRTYIDYQFSLAIPYLPLTWQCHVGTTCVAVTNKWLWRTATAGIPLILMCTGIWLLILLTDYAELQLHKYISFSKFYFYLQWRFLYDHQRMVLSSRTFQNLVLSSWLILGVRLSRAKTTIMWCRQDITVHQKLSLV